MTEAGGHFPVWQTSPVNPDLAAFAVNCSAMGIRVDEVGQLDEVIERALSHSGPTPVEVVTDPALV